jgi:hypothetical protein
MKGMMILLTATTMALVPFASNAKKPPNISDYDLEVLSCSCASEPGPAEGDVIYICDVSWSDAIAGAVNPATYGASIDVEWEQEGVEMDGLRSVDLEYDWSEVCDGVDCTVEDKQFMLTNYTDQTVTLTAAVKAFENRSEGKTPRNFVKSKLACDVAPIEPI